MNQQTLVPYKVITKLFILKPAGAMPAGTPSRFSGLIHSDEAFIFFAYDHIHHQYSHLHGISLLHHRTGISFRPIAIIQI